VIIFCFIKVFMPQEVPLISILDDLESHVTAVQKSAMIFTEVSERICSVKWTVKGKQVTNTASV
jgi:hypothetical protein